MILKKNNIKLRALEPTDLDFLFKTENNTAFWEVSSTQTPFSKYILSKYIANAHQDIYQAKQLRLIIEYKDISIGMIDLFDFNPQHKRAGIGMLILEKFQGKGYAKTALHILISYCFDVLHLHQLYANITADNQASIRLFTTANFKKIGVKKDWIYTKNGYKDEILFQLLNKK